MAKNSMLKTILTAIAMVLCLVTVVTFFLPTFKAVEEDAKEVYNYSSMELAFISAEKAEEKAEEAGKAGEMKEAYRYYGIAELKTNEETKGAIKAIGWIHFFAAVVSVAAIALLVLSMLGKNVGLYATIAAGVAAILAVVALIITCVFVNAEDAAGVKIKEVLMTVGVSTILGTITAVLAPVANVVKNLKK